RDAAPPQDAREMTVRHVVIGRGFADRCTTHNCGHGAFDGCWLDTTARISRAQAPAVKYLLDDPTARPGLDGDLGCATTRDAELRDTFRGCSARRHARRIAIAEEATPRLAHRLVRDARAPGSFAHRDARGSSQQRSA